MLITDATLSVTVRHVSYWHLKTCASVKCALHGSVGIRHVQVEGRCHGGVSVCGFAHHHGGCSKLYLHVLNSPVGAQSTTGLMASKTGNKERHKGLSICDEIVWRYCIEARWDVQDLSPKRAEGVSGLTFEVTGAARLYRASPC